MAERQKEMSRIERLSSCPQHHHDRVRLLLCRLFCPVRKPATFIQKAALLGREFLSRFYKLLSLFGSSAYERSPVFFCLGLQWKFNIKKSEGFTTMFFMQFHISTREVTASQTHRLLLLTVKYVSHKKDLTSFFCRELTLSLQI